ncbi:hypothetical protein ROBYS_43190 [Roseobacter sp. OBYS 0001]|nr:hypothetical protein ROBYS_43190 [Roseobacter sp. OBYS 0001]
MSKTATTSLCDALEILGFKSIHYAPISRIKGSAVHLTWPWWIEDYEAMADLPVACLYKELGARFPNAIFVLTVRNEREWLVSARKHFSLPAYNRAKHQSRFRQSIALDKHMYGSNVFEESCYLEAFRTHNEAVRRHFAKHPKFHELDICGGDGWNELCKIVDRPIPDSPFPRSNVRVRGN